MSIKEKNNKLKVLIAIPAFNEAESIGSVIENLLNFYERWQILVVDDGSSDSTLQIVDSYGIRHVSLPFNVGVGGAMRTAFKFAIERDFDAVVQLDADGQHDPKYIAALIEGLYLSDVVIGSRFSGIGTYRTIGPRRWAMRLLAKFVSKLTNTRFSDVTSGFRATGPAALKLFSKHYPVEYLGDTVESILLAHRAGLKVIEVPVEMRYRFGGRPSQSIVQASLFLLRAFLVLILAVIRPEIKYHN